MNDNRFGKAANRLLETYRVRYLGIGLLWAWIYCCWVVPTFSQQSADSVNQAYLISITANTATLIFAPCIARDKRLFETAPIRIASLIAIVAGTVLTMAWSNDLALQSIGGLLSGIAAGMFWLFWAELFGRLDVEVSETLMPVSVVLLPACCVISTSMADAGSALFTAALPILSYAALMVSFAKADETKTSRSDKSIAVLSSQAKRWKGFWRPFLTIGAIAVIVHAAIGMIWILEPGGMAATIPSRTNISMFVAALAAMGVSLLVSIYARRPDIYTMYRWLLPMVVIALALLSFQEPWSARSSVVLALTAQFGYTIALWTFFARVSRFGWATPAICMGVSHGFAQAGLLLGNVAGTYVVTLSMDPSQACVLCICICVTTVLLLANRESVLGTHGGQNANRAVNRSTVPESKDACASNGKSESGDRRLDKLIENTDITAREREVLALLVQGRSVPFIQEELCVSRNTVNTHVKHIYRKLKVHTKQELIDLYVTQ